VLAAVRPVRMLIETLERRGSKAGGQQGGR
jgi:hypothetical protein